MFIIAIIIGVFVESNIYFLVISAIAAVLFSAYLLSDLQVKPVSLQVLAVCHLAAVDATTFAENGLQ